MKISLGMIVRNEGHTLERCLNSVAPYVDEIVIGLAGKSTDNTEAIARKFTDNVFNIEWKDDFAAARNAVLDKQTGDYYLWLDGDDELIGGDKLRQYPITYPDAGAFHMGYDYWRDSSGNTVSYLIRERLVKAELNWHWLGRIHETLNAEIAHKPHLVEDILVRHYPKEGSTDRNFTLLRKELLDTEPNPTPRTLLYLGNEYASRGFFNEAILHWRRYLAYREWDEEAYQIVHKIADAYREMGEYDKSERADFEAIKIAPHWPDAYFGLAETAYRRGHWQAVVEWTKAGSTKKAPDTSLIINPRDYDYYPLRNLGLAYARLGEIEAGLDNLQRAYAVHQEDDLVDVIDALQQDYQTEVAVKHVTALREILGRNDEWLKVRRLFEVVPKIAEEDPRVQELWWRTAQQTAHVDDPDALVNFYGDNPDWVSMPDDVIFSEEWQQHPRMKYAATVAGPKPIKILDVGCSDGFIDLPLAVSGHSVVGVDLDPRCVALGNERAKTRSLPAKFWTGTVQDITATDFDLAIAFEIIEHLVDVPSFLDELDKRAKHVALTTPYLAWENGQLPNWDKIEPKGHLRTFDLNDLERHLSHRGRINNLFRQPYGRSSWIFSDYFPGQQWLGAVSIITGNTFEEWGPRKLASEGLGGSETAVIKLGEALATHNYKTTVYGRIDAPGIYSGVTYRQNDAWIPDVHSDLCIAWRGPEVADNEIRTDHLVLWMHDTDSGDRLTKERADKFEKIIVLSEWHKSNMMKLYPFIPEEKYVVIGNGVDRSRFTNTVERDPFRVIYASSPDRGLDVILEHIWPRVAEAVPEAELHIYYGWNNFDIAAQAVPRLREFKSRVANSLLASERVTVHGRIPQDELAREFQKSGVWLYPTYFPETYCITAIEAQLAGLIPITNQLAALKETVASGIIIDGDVYDQHVIDEYVDKTIKLLESGDSKKLRKKIQKNAPARSWEERAEQWITLLHSGSES